MDQILQTLIKYVLGIFGIGSIVILHELGHFIAAHLNGIEVEIFSLGFGPKIVGIKLRKTEYRLSLILFGGYCRLKGSDDLTRALDIKSNKFIHIENGSLFSVHPFHRLMTYLAGPLTNVLISIALCTILAALSYSTLSTPAYVAPVSDYPTFFNNNSSPAKDAGIIKGDQIISIENTKIRDYQEVVDILTKTKKQDLKFTIKRKFADGTSNNSEYVVSGVKNENNTFRYGLTNIVDTTIASVRFLSPEEKAGLKKEDNILSVNGIIVANNLDLLKELEVLNDSPITLRILRGNKILSINYSKDFSEGKYINNFSLYSPTRIIKGQPLNTALITGFNNAFNLFSNTVNSLLSVINGRSDDVRQVFTGPVRASLMIGDITVMGFENNVKSGLRALCYLLAVVSISIAIANILPLPAFDGGQILISLIEGITGKRISPRNYWRAQLIGMIGLICIFAFMYFIDIRYFYLLNLKR
ncbi:MAG: RIP metalloprotease RseP [Spirochaetaceae bacterium]|nr:RIP metalloprotease RseP [Spirochaetaceae bacterium]